MKTAVSNVRLAINGLVKVKAATEEKIIPIVLTVLFIIMTEPA